MHLRPVVGIDVDVFCGEIAGPNCRRRSARLQIEADADVVLLQDLFRLAFVKPQPHAIFADGQAANMNVSAVGIEGHAGVACSAENAAPVGVFACHGCFEQG